MANSSEINDILLCSIGSPQGSVQTMKDRKPRKPKTTEVSNLTEWDQVTTPPKPQTKKDITKWSGRDFRIYVYDKYYTKFSVKLDMPIQRTYSFFGKLNVILGRAIKSPSEEVSPAIMKEYIDIYFDRHIEETVAQYKMWRVEYLNNAKVVAEFASNFAGSEIKPVDRPVTKHEPLAL